jgi:predicted TIM-barrel fold metal-dependent hydrolase
MSSSPTRPPKQQAPALTCDCHFHIFGPYDKFPLSSGRTYNPPPALVPDYLAMAEKLGIQRMVVVQASVSGTDNAVTLDAVRQFGQHRARAVAVIDDSFNEATLKQMHTDGVRGVRFNLASGNGTPVEQLQTVARRIAPLGWHIQVYIDGETLADMAPALAKLPVEIVIDHCGGVKAALGLEHPQFRALLSLLDSGNAWIKVCSYRVSSTGQPWADPAPNVQAFVSRYPDRCVWGTDWPHPQMNPLPEAGLLLDQFFDWVPDAATQHRILVDNPAKIYGF